MKSQADLDLDRVTQAIDRLPAVPAVVHEINRILASPDANASVVARAVERDQIVTVKLLRLANSAFFGCRGRVGSVAHAVILMGFNLLRNVVLSCALRSALGDRGVMGQIDLDRFWNHAFATALLSRRISELARTEEQDEAFLGGLLHDVGQIVLVTAFGKPYIEVLESAASEEGLLLYERTSFSMDHPQAGKLLADKWNLPRLVCRAIAEHHQSEHSAGADLPRIVSLGDKVARTVGHGGLCPDIEGFDLAGQELPPGVRLDLTELRSQLDEALNERQRGPRPGEANAPR